MCFAPTFERQKVVRTWCVLYILTWKCASRHNGVHFFDMSTSKSGPNLVCFVHILTWKCASRQNGVHFFDTQLPKVVRTWRVLYILTWKCASHHNGVQLLICRLARWLRTRRFSEPTFRPSRAANHWKHTVNRDFPTFSRTCIFFLLWSSHFFSSPLWLFPPLLFQLSILSEVSLLSFLRQYSLISIQHYSLMV